MKSLGKPKREEEVMKKQVVTLQLKESERQKYRCKTPIPFDPSFSIPAAFKVPAIRTRISALSC